MLGGNDLRNVLSPFYGTRFYDVRAFAVYALEAIQISYGLTVLYLNHQRELLAPNFWISEDITYSHFIKQEMKIPLIGSNFNALKS